MTRGTRQQWRETALSLGLLAVLVGLMPDGPVSSFPSIQQSSIASGVWLAVTDDTSDTLLTNQRQRIAPSRASVVVAEQPGCMRPRPSNAVRMAGAERTVPVCRKIPSSVAEDSSDPH